jgi:hypothetical protein
VQSSQSAFSLGYITGNTGNNDSYGYFSAFGDFQFASGDTTYMCGDNVLLQGGYAMGYEWYFGGQLVGTSSSYEATEEGCYTLVMNQDPNIVTASTVVQRVNAGVISPANQLLCSATATPALLTVTGAVTPTGTQYQWQSSSTGAEGSWTNIATNATSASYQPPALPTGATIMYYRRGMTSIYCELAYTLPTAITTTAGTVTPASQIQCESDATLFTPLTLTPTAAFPGASYQWQKSDDNGATWANTGSGTITYQPLKYLLPPTSPGPATLTNAYRCLVTSNACTVPTAAVTVSLSPCIVPANPHLRSRAVP